ncbi:UNVERIFIED_CONTAM: hypothetical protein NCL1_08128 [Trichonephila clavipes]
MISLIACGFRNQEFGHTQIQLYRIPPPPPPRVNIRRHCCALSATARLRDSAASMTPCKSPAEDAKLGTVRVSQQPVELPDIQHDVDAELGTALVSQQLCELPHAPPVQAFAVQLVETFR